MTSPPTPTQVLVIEDTPEAVEMIEAALMASGPYEVHNACNGSAGLELVRRIDPDVVILDLGLPDLDGTEVCRGIRSFTEAYVLMLTSRGDEVDRLVGLAVGADDYLTKPFSPRELAARVQVLLRRPRSRTKVNETSGHLVITVGDMVVDTLAREVTVGGKLVELTRIEFELLAALAARPEMVYTRQLLVDSIWGDEWYGDDHFVSVHIANLRKKIDSGGGSRIKTVRGVGYRMDPEMVLLG